jgi:hypothetical protein
VFLTETGTLFRNEPIPNSSYVAQQLFHCGVALEAGWDGNILWEVREPDHHHDGLRLHNGNVLRVCYAPLPAQLVPQMKGGVPGSEHAGEIYADCLVELTIEGERIWEWRCWEHDDPQNHPFTEASCPRAFWPVGNCSAEWPNGDISLSFRSISTVVTISHDTGALVLELGAPPRNGQHAPTPLANGHLLIFENGPHDVDENLNYSRVIEVDPATNEIVGSTRITRCTTSSVHGSRMRRGWPTATH